MSKHVFLSFVEEHLPSVVLFRGQAKNKNSDLEFDDFSVKVPYDSTDTDYIRSQVATKIQDASATIGIIGATTSTSSWVTWEIEKSVALGNKVEDQSVDWHIKKSYRSSRRRPAVAVVVT